jgi:hypothetical protein
MYLRGIRVHGNLSADEILDRLMYYNKYTRNLAKDRRDGTTQDFSYATKSEILYLIIQNLGFLVTVLGTLYSIAYGRVNQLRRTISALEMSLPSKFSVLIDQVRVPIDTSMCSMPNMSHPVVMWLKGTDNDELAELVRSEDLPVPGLFEMYQQSEYYQKWGPGNLSEFQKEDAQDFRYYLKTIVYPDRSQNPSLIELFRHLHQHKKELEFIRKWVPGTLLKRDIEKLLAKSSSPPCESNPAAFQVGFRHMRHMIQSDDV